MSSPPLRIAYLCEVPALAPELASAHLETFGPLLPVQALGHALKELRSHTRPGGVPTTLLALEGEGWVGSASLLQNGRGRARAHSPWLANLYVKPEARGRGIGRALVARCIADAAAAGVQTLYLYCMEALVDYYQALGWRRHDRVALSGVEVSVLAVDAVGRA